MKIDKIVFSCSEEFSPFWNMQSFIWKEMLGIEPVCILWGKIENTDMKDTHGEIIEKEYNPDLVKSFQLTWSKFYHTQTEPETTWIIGDIDLFPLQREWFIDKIEELPDDVYTHLAYGVLNDNHDFEHESGDWASLAAYYHVAKGKIFQKALGLDECSYEEQIRRVTNDTEQRFGRPTTKEDITNHWEWTSRHGHSPYITPEGDETELQYWLADEKYSSYRLFDAHTKKEIKFISHITPDLSEMKPNEGKGIVDRVDRANFNSGEYTHYGINRIQNFGYVDLHAFRPYKQQENALKKIMVLTWGQDILNKLKENSIKMNHLISTVGSEWWNQEFPDWEKTIGRKK